MKETELYEPACKWLREHGFKYIFPEVQLYMGDNRADIAAYRDDKMTAVCELKTSLSLTVIDQAFYWHRWANYVLIVTPEVKGSYRARPQIINRIFWEYKFGWLTVSREYYNEKVQPQYIRQKRDRFNLYEVLKNRPNDLEIKGGMATGEGKYFTAYRYTIMQVERFIREMGGRAKLKDIMDNVNTHYATNSARQSLLSAMKNFERDKFLIIKNGREITVQLTEVLPTPDAMRAAGKKEE